MGSEKRQKNQTNKNSQRSETIRVHKIIGQVQGIEKMIEDQRPLSQVVQQVHAASADLQSLKQQLLKRHLEESMSDSIKTGNYSKFHQEVLQIMRMTTSQK